MATDKELINAAELLKENCLAHNGDGDFDVCCKGCTFDYEMGCPLCNRSVFAWKIPKTRRFTDTDILWAKALKTIGVDEIIRYEGSTYRISKSNTEEADYINLPRIVFNSIRNGEVVQIEEILKEAEK